ncbi:molybdate-anion transporter [Ammospiza nelsoni]|uniref:molybdate-anion transporter n=1 Tax=Ammospiza caudacuta TaxID=2857398 RepID=UPI0027396A22|nr:molybdate-anion transporter [Ammospiza caudacuta]XP_059347263.1 molybdate-anion transporter [Ammospiza nelsoni]
MFLLPCSALALLLLTCLALEPAPHRPPPSNPAFRGFQRRFLLGYLPALAADWLQGPLLFQLLHSRGFLRSQIAALYSCGFASNVAFGLVSGLFVDRLGRKKSCVLSSGLCSVSCLLQLSHDFLALAAARVLAGLGTSLLFSAFECWYLHEHLERHDFPAEWIPDTFSRVALWNSGLAVAAGLLAWLLAEVLPLGPAAPFLAALPFLALSGIFAGKNWDENYGKSRPCGKACGEGLRGLVSEPRALLLGLVQALVESILLIFAFLWTPVLEAHGIPLGIAFSAFTAASAAGSALFRRGATGRLRLQPLRLLPGSVLLLALALVLLALPLDAPGDFLAVLLLQLSCGIYFPAMAFLRRRLERGGDAAGGARWLRLPLGLAVALALPALPGDPAGTRAVLGAAALAALVALGAAGGVLGTSRGDEGLRVGDEGLLEGDTGE